MTWLDDLLENLFPPAAYDKNPQTLTMNQEPASEVAALTNPSPNFTKGRIGHTPIAIVLHVMDGTLAGTDAWFADPSSAVSAHWGVGKDGTIHHYVHESDAAWHCGVVRTPSWALCDPKTNPNLVTVGIEHEGLATDRWTQEQKNASAKLISQIAARWNIPLDREHVIGHYEIDSITRPNCPSVDKVLVQEMLNLALQVV